MADCADGDYEREVEQQALEWELLLAYSSELYDVMASGGTVQARPNNAMLKERENKGIVDQSGRLT